MAACALDSRVLKTPFSKILGTSFGLDFLGVQNHENVLRLCSAGEINQTTTGKVLENFQRRKVSVVNIVGTPRQVCFGSTITSLCAFAQNCGAALQFMPIDPQDNLSVLLRNSQFWENSDGVVGITDAVQDGEIIDWIQRERWVLGIYVKGSIVYISTSNLPYFGDFL